MNKILMSIMSIGIVAAMMGAGTFAYFQDSATSGTNIFDNTDLIPTGSPEITVTGTSQDYYPDGTTRGSEHTIDFDGTNSVNIVFDYVDLLPGYNGVATLDVLPNFDSHIYLTATAGTAGTIASQIAFWMSGADYTYGIAFDEGTYATWTAYTTAGGKSLSDFLTSGPSDTEVDIEFLTSQTTNEFTINWVVNPYVTLPSEIAGSVDFGLEFAAYQIGVTPTP